MAEREEYKVLEYMRERPGMYLGNVGANLTALNHFMDGYKAALYDFNVRGRKDMFPLTFDYMHEYVCIELGEHNNLGWCHNILNHCKGDEEKAFDMFFELYDKFMNIGMTGYWKTALSDDNIRYNDSIEHGARGVGVGGVEPWFIDPVAVYIIELTIPACILAVETKRDVHLEKQFFKTVDDAKGTAFIPFCAETYFGKIDGWKRFDNCEIEFDKLIYY